MPASSTSSDATTASNSKEAQPQRASSGGSATGPGNAAGSSDLVTYDRDSRLIHFYAVAHEPELGAESLLRQRDYGHGCRRRTLQLSLDGAIQRGIQANLAITEARIQQQQSDAQRLQSLNSLLPDVKAEASTGAHQYNPGDLQVQPNGLISQFAPLFPGLNIAGTSRPSLKVDVTTADAALDWTMLDLAAITRYRSAKGERESRVLQHPIEPGAGGVECRQSVFADAGRPIAD